MKKKIQLFIRRKEELTTHSKHLVIATFKRLFGLSPDDAALSLIHGFKKANIESTWPKRSAHSTYKTKTPFQTLKSLDNKYNVDLTLITNTVIEQNNANDDSFQKIDLIVTVNIDEFPPWYEQNKLIIKRLSGFISEEKKFDNHSYKLFLNAVKDISPNTEQHIIEPSCKWYRSHLTKYKCIRPKKTPISAELIIINVDDNEDDDVASNPAICLLLRPSEAYGYIPVKFYNPLKEKNIYDYLFDHTSNFSITAQKEENRLTITLKLSNEARSTLTYKTVIEQVFKPIVNNPFTGKPVFNKLELWDSSLPNITYSLVEKNLLSNCISDLTSTNGLSDKLSVEHTLQRFHQHLSLKGLYEQAVPKMFIEKKGAKIKPTKFIMN